MSPPSPPSLRTMLGRDSCLQPDTRNSFGISGNVFEDLPAPSEPHAAFCGHSRSSGSALCELESLKTGRLSARAYELERTIQNIAIPSLRFARKFSTWNPPCHAEGAISRIAWLSNRGIRSRNCTSMNTLIFRHFSVGQRASRPRYVPVVTFLRKLCFGSKKWRWSIQWTIIRRRSHFGGHIFPNFEMLGAKIASALKKIIMNTYFKKKVGLQLQKAQNGRPIAPWKTDCVYDLQKPSGDWSS